MKTSIIEQKEVRELVSNSLKNAMTYPEYRELIDDLARDGSTTGDLANEELAEFTKLNARRFKRWEKTLDLNIFEEEIRNLPAVNMSWLVITESWCGDAAHLMPVMKALADQLTEVELSVVLRDENPELMDEFLTEGTRAIPKLIAMDNDSGAVKFLYGPRPSVVTEMANKFKAEHGKLSPEFKEDLQRWYNKDKGLTTMNDLVTLLKR
ncbi:MAG: thioredoxin family protein [Flavobacteriaceae bacterium]|nr:thioredoxin family protein [Bacteroidia bacterium]NNF73973.1 thioredoxin family protein [Flavobacteriaceae bacterium]